MCGIAGFIKHNPKFDIDEIAKKMDDSLLHRGPDSRGIWLDKEAGITLLHRRLSILDLSIHGHQPMLSFCGRFVIIFNGEIYNHLQIRKQLEKANNIIWRGHSDTETLLTALSIWGVAKTLENIIGMFALALWDKKTKKLFLARDRAGEKPLYYGFIDGGFVFASELKTFKCYPNFKAEINMDSLYQYLSLDYVPAPLTIYQNIFKLKPGTYLEFAADFEIIQHKYWDLAKVITAAKQDTFADPKNAICAVKNALHESIKGQVLSDVPLGAFLSGGIDSSCVAALMQEQNSSAIKTFTIGFENKAFDESLYARQVSKHLGTEHHEMILQASDCIDLVPNLMKIYDEPFADSSQIPTYFVSKLASQTVKVALSGDGGDELFGGYSRYGLVPKFWNKIKLLPYFARKILAQCILSTSSDIYQKINNYLPKSYKFNHLSDKAYKFGARLHSINSAKDFYVSLLTKDYKAQNFLKNTYPFRKPFYENDREFIFDNIVDNMMFVDSIYYLPDDILTKVDRASMAWSIEARAPFLDARLIDLAWQLPLNMKINKGKSKWVLRQILQDYLPDNLINRPKMGFGIPLSEWLRKDLSSWLSDLLGEQRIIAQNIFDITKIHNILHEHQTGKKDWAPFLWNMAIFQSWYGENFKC